MGKLQRSFVVMLVLLLLMGLQGTYGAEDVDSKDILLLHSYSQSYIWTADEQEGILDTLGKSSRQYNISIEYMDTKQHYSEAYYKELEQFLLFKYRERTFDAVAVTDDNGLRFVLERKDTLFKDMPLFFCGANSLDSYSFDDIEYVYGLEEVMSLEETVIAIQNLMGVKPHLVFLFDHSVSADLTKLEIDKVMQREFMTTSYEFIRSNDPQAMLDQLEAIDQPNVAVVYGFLVVSGGQREYDPQRMAKVISEGTDRPVFALWDFAMDTQVIGGKLISGYQQGASMAILMETFFDGDMKTDHQLIRNASSNRHIYDFNGLNAHGFDPNRLADGSEVRNHPITFIEQHRDVLLVSIGIIILLLLYITLLRVQVRRKTATIERTMKHVMEYRRQASLVELVAGIAHELNTPLGTILTSGSFNQKQIDDLQLSQREGKLESQMLKSTIAHMKDASRMVVGSVQHAIQLVDGFKKIAIYQQRDNYARVNLNTAIGDIIQPLVRSQINPKVQFTIEGDAKIYHPIAPGLLYDIFEPLVVNSIQHGFPTKPLGMINIRLTKENDLIRIVYTDNGVGMEEGACLRAFEPFYSTKKMDSHLGLGLFRVYNAVCAVCGTIECVPNEGLGVKFTILLPMQCDLNVLAGEG